MQDTVFVGLVLLTLVAREQFVLGFHAVEVDWNTLSVCWEHVIALQTILLALAVFSVEERPPA